MCGWMDEWISVGLRWMDGWMDQCWLGWMDGWMDECVGGWMNGSVLVGVDG